MPPQIQEVIRRRVIQLWLNGEARDKIASDLQIGAGTVSGIVSDFKKNLQISDLDIEFVGWQQPKDFIQLNCKVRVSDNDGWMCRADYHVVALGDIRLG